MVSPDWVAVIGLISWLQPVFLVFGIAEVALGILLRRSLNRETLNPGDNVA